MNAAVPLMTGGLVALALLALLRKPLMLLLKLTVRSAVGYAALFLLQTFGGGLGITLGANLGNALVLGLLGVPGFGLLLMVQWLLKS